MANRVKRTIDPDQQSSVEELVIAADDEIERQQVMVEERQMRNAAGVRMEAIEKAMYGLASAFERYRTETTKGAWPRIEVLVDTNCLVTYTGPIEAFDKEYFRQVLEDTIRGRIELTDSQAKLMKAMAKDSGPRTMEVG